MSEVREEDSPLCSQPPESVATFFEDVFAKKMDSLQPPPPSAVLPPTLPQEPALVATITKEDIVARLARNGNTAPGPDGVTYSTLRTKDRGAHILFEVFRVCLEHGRIPKAWKESRTILIFKKGDKQDMSNWRPISLSSCIYKTYSGILADRLSRWAASKGAVSRQQKGFMPAEGCMEHNFLVQQILDDTRANNKQAVITWLDLKNAFGSVPHVAVLDLLRQHGVHDHLLDVIEDLYAENTTTITTASGETRPVRMESGVKQGDPLSPIVFNLVMEVLLRSVLAHSDLHGYVLRGHRVTCLGFADDLVLTAWTPRSMQALLDIIGEVASWIGLSFNAKKCSTLHVSNKKALSTRTRIQGEDIKAMGQADAYLHLGVPTGLYIDQTPEETVEHMIQDLHAIEHSLLTDWQKLDAIRTFVLPQITFTLSTARVKKRHFDLLDKAVKRVAKAAMHLPRRASPEIIAIPTHLGGANIMALKELADVGAVVHAHKVLTCPDMLVRQVALASLKSTVTEVVGHPPNNAELAAYLSAEQMPRPSHAHATIWSYARNAVRQLRRKVNGLQWQWQDADLGPSISLVLKDSETIIGPARRKDLHCTLREALQDFHHRRLIAKPVQGKVMEAVSLDPASNHFLHSGRHTRFCDWRFVHRARLGVLPLNGQLHLPDQPRKCRRCAWDNETTAHVLCHCQRHSGAWRNRHGAVIKTLVDAMQSHANLRVEKTIRGTGSRLLPDLVVRDEATKNVVIVDVCCPFDNRPQALNAARAEKIRKYSPLVATLKQQGYTAGCEAVVVGALGSWDPANTKALSMLDIPQHKRAALAKKCVSEVIRWSRDIYVEHVSGHRMYQEDVVVELRAPTPT